MSSAPIGGPYRAPQPPVQPSQRDELLKSIADIEKQCTHFTASCGVLDRFITQQRDSIPTLVAAQNGTDLAMHEALGELGTTVTDVATIINKAQKIRNIFYYRLECEQARLNRLKERVG